MPLRGNCSRGISALVSCVELSRDVRGRCQSLVLDERGVLSWRLSEDSEQF